MGGCTSFFQWNFVIYNPADVNRKLWHVSGKNLLSVMCLTLSCTFQDVYRYHCSYLQPYISFAVFLDVWSLFFWSLHLSHWFLKFLVLRECCTWDQSVFALPCIRLFLKSPMCTSGSPNQVSFVPEDKYLTTFLLLGKLICQRPVTD